MADRRTTFMILPQAIEHAVVQMQRDDRAAVRASLRAIAEIASTRFLYHWSGRRMIRRELRRMDRRGMVAERPIQTGPPPPVLADMLEDFQQLAELAYIDASQTAGIDMLQPRVLAVIPRATQPLVEFAEGQVDLGDPVIGMLDFDARMLESDQHERTRFFRDTVPVVIQKMGAEAFILAGLSTIHVCDPDGDNGEDHPCLGMVLVDREACSTRVAFIHPETKQVGEWQKLPGEYDDQGEDALVTDLLNAMKKER